MPLFVYSYSNACVRKCQGVNGAIPEIGTYFLSPLFGISTMPASTYILLHALGYALYNPEYGGTAMADEWISVKEAAGMLGVKDARIRQLVMEDRLVSRKWDARTRQISKKSIEQFKRLPRGPKPKKEQ